MASDYRPAAPPLQVAQWFNTREPITLEGLRGRVVLLHAFQMLCPGCVEKGIPQAQRVHEAFSQDQVVVIGLHTVFEHHAVQGTPAALQAFIHEYRLRFPIALDQPHATRGIPLSMEALMLQGTPSLVVLDKEGRMRLHHFGHLDDLRLGALLGQLLTEPALPATTTQPRANDSDSGCDAQGCPRPDMPTP
ncbi:MAG: redoxin domain-containing protein [Proteobacteria bacterium]|nr:redoxin domain-containing protein [Pseudomonadota bacterium]